MAIEILVVALLPLCLWPTIVSCISLLPGVYASMENNWTYCHGNCGIYDKGAADNTWTPWYYIEALQINPSSMTLTFVITATFAALAPTLGFFLYLCITAVTDTIRGHAFLEHPDDIARTSLQTGHRLFLLGTPRTPEKRAAVVQHCARYIFKHSVFRRHGCVPG